MVSLDQISLSQARAEGPQVEVVVPPRQTQTQFRVALARCRAAQAQLRVARAWSRVALAQATVPLHQISPSQTPAGGYLVALPIQTQTQFRVAEAQLKVAHPN